MKQADVATRTRLEGEVVPAADATPTPSTAPARARRGLSTEAWVGIVLGGVILASAALVVARFALPSEDAGALDLPQSVYHGDAGAVPPDAAAADALPYRLAAPEERERLEEAMEAHQVAFRGELTADYAAYLTAVSWVVANLEVDASGRLWPGTKLSPEIQALLTAHGVTAAVDATVDYLLASGELPRRVRVAAKSFLARNPPVAVAAPDGTRPGYGAAAIAVLLSPEPTPDALLAVALENDGLGRWQTPSPGRRHVAPHLVEPAALVARLEAVAPGHAGLAAARAWTAAGSYQEAVRWEAGALRVASAHFQLGATPGDLVLEVSFDPPEVADLRAAVSGAGLAAPVELTPPADDAAGPWRATLPRAVSFLALVVTGRDGRQVSFKLPPPALL